MRNQKQLLAAFIIGLSFVSTSTTHALLSITNRYDFEPASGYVTEAGWTHMDLGIIFTATTAGFSNNPVTYGGFDRFSSTQSPTNVTRDEIIGRGAGSSVIPTVWFRDIVPAHSTNVSFTIYRSDPIDTFNAAFTTKVRYNGGPLVLVDSGAGFGLYHTPITGNLALSPVTNNTTLDFYFYDTAADSSNLRLNGIETVFTIPEPTTAMLFVLTGLLSLFKRRQ